MKRYHKCRNCGCINHEKRRICADCSRSLTGSEPVDDQALESLIQEKTKYTDLFSFKPWYQVVFYLSLAFIFADIALLIFLPIAPTMILLSIFCFCVSILNTRFPKLIWAINKAVIGLFYSGELHPYHAEAGNYEGGMKLTIVVSFFFGISTMAKEFIGYLIEI